VSIESLRHATTPLFSPIPFHPDNNQETADPPLSPFDLDTKRPLPEETGPAALGRVDELDDLVPGHNHMADHPTPISSTTEIPMVEEKPTEVGEGPVKKYERSNAPEPETPRVEEAREAGTIPVGEDEEVEDMVLDEDEPNKKENQGDKDVS
jgi:serine/threonine-protein phosphatase 4 regulatory subunit 2